MSPRPCPDPNCSIARSLTVLGERWALLIVREAFYGKTRFSEFRSSLGVSPDILAARLTSLVEAGVLTRQTYREPGEREREEYLLTPAGHDLVPVMAALGHWGTEHRPLETSVSGDYIAKDSGERARLAFVTESGRVLESDEVDMTRPRAAV